MFRTWVLLAIKSEVNFTTEHTGISNANGLYCQKHDIQTSLSEVDCFKKYLLSMTKLSWWD